MCAVTSRATYVRSLLGDLGRLCAIVDDVWQAEAARGLMAAVPPGCPLVITTRDGDLAKALGCRVERIDRLSSEEALVLLTQLLGPLDGHQEAAAEIVALTEGLPLALELIAGQADSPADLPRLAAKLRDRPPLPILKLAGGESRQDNVESCLALSYAALDAAMQRRFRALGALAPAPYGQAAMAAVWGEEDGEAVEDAVHHLARRHLLVRQETGDYRQHALLRAYALALLDEEAETDEIAQRHASYFRSFAEEEPWQEIERYFEQIDCGWRWVQRKAPDEVIPYCLAVDRFLSVRGRLIEDLLWLEAGLSRAELDGDQKRKGRLLNNVGWAQNALGRKEEALKTFKEALALRREVGDRWGEAVTLFNIGRALEGLERLEEAVAHLEKAVALDEAIGRPDLESDRQVLEGLRKKLAKSKGRG